MYSEAVLSEHNSILGVAKVDATSVVAMHDSSISTLGACANISDFGERT